MDKMETADLPLLLLADLSLLFLESRLICSIRLMMLVFHDPRMILPLAWHR